MDDRFNSQSGRVSLTKPQPQPWTDPATGEIYPGGNPNMSQNTTRNMSQPYGNFEGQVYQAQNVPMPMNTPMPEQRVMQSAQAGIGANEKFCSHCGRVINKEAVICPLCGCQVGQFQQQGYQQPSVVINNNNNNAAMLTPQQYGRRKDKWVAVLLCFFFGVFGVHRFYEGKVGSGLLYLFTFGLFGIGAFVDFIILLCKPNPYYV